MKVSITNVYGVKVYTFRNKQNQFICSLRKSKVQPQFGYRLEVMTDLIYHSTGNLLSYSYKTIKTFPTANQGISYITHNFEEIEQQQKELIK